METVRSHRSLAQPGRPYSRRRWGGSSTWHLLCFLSSSSSLLQDTLIWCTLWRSITELDFTSTAACSSSRPTFCSRMYLLAWLSMATCSSSLSERLLKRKNKLGGAMSMAWRLAAVTKCVFYAVKYLSLLIRRWRRMNAATPFIVAASTITPFGEENVPIVGRNAPSVQPKCCYKRGEWGSRGEICSRGICLDNRSTTQSRSTSRKRLRRMASPRLYQVRLRILKLSKLSQSSPCAMGLTHV
mmetsp:Transcript_7083/g.16199  ORF Transcript_7083/g.16199 Transcript_7083/m.16199 type:complete len:242 (-) Transcript_7083:142-867(-)